MPHKPRKFRAERDAYEKQVALEMEATKLTGIEPLPNYIPYGLGIAKDVPLLEAHAEGFQWASGPDADRQELAQEMLALASPEDARLLRLYYWQGLTQERLAEVYGLSQPTICYQLARAAQRTALRASLPRLSDEDVIEQVLAWGYTDQQAQAVAAFLRMHSQSRAGEAAGRTQGWARYWLDRVLDQHPESPIGQAIQMVNAVVRHKVAA